MNHDPFMGGCPAPLNLDALFAGEPASPRLASHVKRCDRCAEYLASLEQARELFMKAHPADRFLRQLSARPQLPARTRHAWRIFAMVAAMGLVALALPRPAVRLKGQRFTAAYRRPGEEAPHTLAPGMVLRPGDQLRFFYAAPNPGYLFILEVDGAGHVSSFFPFNGARSGAVKADERLLPGSVALDATPGPSTLLAVFTSKPLELETLAAQLRGLAPGIPIKLTCGECQVEMLPFQKER